MVFSSATMPAMLVALVIAAIGETICSIARKAPSALLPRPSIPSDSLARPALPSLIEARFFELCPAAFDSALMRLFTVSNFALALSIASMVTETPVLATFAPHNFRDQTPPAMQFRQRQGQRPEQPFAEEAANAGRHDLYLAGLRQVVQAGAVSDSSASLAAASNAASASAAARRAARHATKGSGPGDPMNSSMYSPICITSQAGRVFSAS